jgi:ribonuclease Z
LNDGRHIQPEKVIGPTRPGRKIVYSGDTRFFKRLTEIAQGADLLIHESTFADDLLDKAIEDGHSTPSQVGKIAKIAKVKLLVLTHISARYTDPTILLHQVKSVFKNTLIAKDFLELEVALSNSK